MRTAFRRLGIGERRVHPAQRRMVDALLAGALGEAILTRTETGNVFVYDEQAKPVRPRTVRTLVWGDGRVEREVFD